MKTLILFLAAFFALPVQAEANDELRPKTPEEVCKDQVRFKYNFDMMKIEGEQIRGNITHRESDEKKSERHEQFKEDLEDCED